MIPSGPFVAIKMFDPEVSVRPVVSGRQSRLTGPESETSQA